MSGWSVYGRGSYFAEAEDPKDIDVLVVTDEELCPEEAAPAVAALLSDLGAPLDRLPLDLSVLPLTALADPLIRAAAQDGRLLDGQDVAGALPPVRGFEWAMAMANLAGARATERPWEAALAAIRALWAGQGRTVVAKSAVPAAARGTRWEALAGAAWGWRPEHGAFAHADLQEALQEAMWAPAGEAASEEYEAEGWSSRANRAAVLTIFRGVLTPDEVTRLATARPEGEPRVGGWTKAPAPDDLARALSALAAIAHGYWWRDQPLAGVEPLALHRYPVGSTFPAHVDRCPMFPSRLCNLVAMVQPAQRGGQLFLDLGGEPIRPRLDPGDVVIFDGSALHGVTEVEAGERIALVTHLHRKVG